jgi:hypothetical protein
MKSIIFWDMTLFSPLSSNRRFGGTHRFHLQGRTGSANQQAGGKPTATCLLIESISPTMKMAGMFLRNAG